MSTEEVLSGAKKCTKCGGVKPPAEFYRYSGSRGGYRSWCKTCFNAARAAKRIAWRKEHTEKYMLRKIRSRAKSRGQEFTLTVEDIIIPKICPILGIPLCTSDGRADDASPSLDRLDNTKGYVPGNVNVISWKANQIKSNATVAELRAIADWMERALQNGTTT